MNIRDTRKQLAQRLAQAGIEEREAKAMADRLVEHAKGYKPVDLVLYGDRELLPETVERLQAMAERIAKGEPLQYVTGTAHFRGREFAVDPSTLIPRPETEGLVDMVADDLRGISDARILDIGTGSGCIAISLALDVPFAEVEAIDISAGALKVAKANAKALKARVDFLQEDILGKQPTAPDLYDAIVSNPPYVLESEKAEMEARVYEHEPASALFVPDADALRFYKAIGAFAIAALKPGRKLYCEINPLCADDLRRLFLSQGFRNVDLLPDYLGRIRYAIAQK